MGRKSETIKYHRMIDAGENPPEKPCAACETWQPVENFGADRSRKDGRANFCRPCARARYAAWVAANSDRHKETSRKRAARVPQSKRQDAHRRNRYGMEPGEFDRMKAAQGDRCALCREVPKRLIVDHDHSTGAVRGLLCFTCNRGLHLFDAPGMLAAALRYLGRADAAEYLGTAPSVGTGLRSEG